MAIALDIAQIAARLLGGESFDSLMRSLLAKPERELLKYCASVRTFNEQMLDEFFRPNVPGGDKVSVPFSRLPEHSFVQSIPGASEFFQLREDSRKQYFDLWQVYSAADIKNAPKLRTLSKKLASYYESQGEELDVLYQQIVADSKEAERLFNKLYNAADNEFDLGRCQGLIKILEARNTILDSNLRDLHADRQNYLKARSFWSKEYYQTFFYYETAYLGARFDELLNDKSKWIMQLYAPGGRGKTMFLRWLTARRCAPEPARIPCAKIDFDIIDPVTATRNPWMLLFEIARQLNEQIPGNLFGEQLGDLKEFRPVLTRSDRSQRTLSHFEARMTADELQEIPDRFVRALKAARLKKKVVLIFDTLEEVILYQGTDMMALLDAVKKLQEKSDNKICLILSGRYDLNQKLAGFSDAYANQSETLELTPFTPDEARKYLQEKRGVNRLIDVVVEKAEGNPFRLALYADILRSPKVTEKAIREYPSDLLYLIRRVLLRIRNRRVRWLLRYGVIPRKLRLSFVKDVMAPYLPPAMSGASDDDDPEEDIKKELESDNAFEKVLKSPDQKINIERLWNTLNGYASSYSWVTQDEEANTVSFHSDVLNPMRAVLRKHRVYRKLHRAAIRHYEKKAKANPEEWGTWILEAIYHKFQLDSVKAADYWRRQIEHAAAESQPRWRLDFAREVINLNKIDEESSTDGAARPPLVDNKLLAQAQFEVARANVDMGHVGGGDLLWEDARKAFGIYQQLQSGSKKPFVSPARSACVEAAMLISGHERNEALTVIKGALKQRATTKEKIALHIEYAEVLSLTGKYKESAKHYRTALSLAPKARIKPASILQIRKDLAHHYELCGNVKEAIQEYKNALRFAKRKNDDLAVLELSRRLGEIYLASGQIAKAIQLTFGIGNQIADTATKTASKDTTAVEELMRLLNLKGRLALAMRDPLRAPMSEIWALVQQGLREGWQSQAVDQLTGSARELSGLIAAELMNDSAALDDFEQARLSWNAAKDRIGAARCLLHMIDVHLRVAGNVKAARFLLEQAERLSLQRQPDLFIRQELLAAEILTLLGKSATGKKRLQKLAARAKQEKWPAKDRALIAVGSMIQRAQTTRTVSGLKEVIAPFKLIWPPSARLSLLERSYLCPTPMKPSALATPFANFLPEPDWQRIDAPVHALKLADALRMVGRKLAPRSLLQKAEKVFGRTEAFFALRELYLVWDRLGWPDQALPRVSTDQRVLRNFTNYPNWCGSVLLEQAERLIAVKEFDVAQKTLADAARYYEGAQAGSLCLAQLNELRGRLRVEQNLPRQTRNHQPDNAAVAAVKDGFKTLSYARSIYDGLQNRVAVKRLNSYLIAERKRLQAAVTKTSAKSKSKKTASTKRRVAPVARFDHEYAAEFEEKVKLPKNTYALHVHRSPNQALEFKVEFARKSKVRKDWKLSDSRFLSMLAMKPGETFSSVFCQLFPDAWWQISQDMGRFLLQATFDKVPPGTVQHPDVALDVADPILAGIPWEFSLLGLSENKSYRFQDLINVLYRNPSAETSYTNIVRAIQFALQKLLSQSITIDGLYGPATFLAVRTFQRKQKLPATGIADFETIAQLRSALLKRDKNLGKSVLIVQSSTDRQISSRRGHGSLGIDLRFIYRRAGFRVSFVENPNIRMLAEALRGAEPQIIHFCPSMKRSLSSGVYLDFGATESTSNRAPTDRAPLSSAATGESSYFSLSAVGKLLADFSADKAIRPFVILDVPPPPVISEAVIQLVLRNDFASQVFRMGSTCAVLATGLMDPRQQDYVELIVRSLAMKRGPGKLVSELRNLPAMLIRKLGRKSVPDPESLSLLLGPIGTALFTQNPSYLA